MLGRWGINALAKKALYLVWAAHVVLPLGPAHAQAGGITVNGGYYSTIQDAIDACNGTAANHCVVSVPPGDYSEDLDFTAHPYTHIQCVSRDACALFGEHTMEDATYFENVRFEASDTSTDYAINCDGKAGIHIRNSSFLAGPQSGPFRTGKFGYFDECVTVLFEDVLIDYRGSGFGMEFRGPTTGEAINADLVMDDVFYDCVAAGSAGGCLYVKDVWNARAFGRRWRTSVAGTAIKVERTTGVTGAVDFLIEGMSVEWGAPSIYVGENTNFFTKHSTVDSFTVEGTLYIPGTTIGG